MNTYYQHPQHKIIDGLLTQYFENYVPAMGGADTEGGELTRAMNRIIYRWHNDGDQIMEGYGRETCNPAARSIVYKLAHHKLLPENFHMQKMLARDYNTEGDRYDYAIYEDAVELLDIFDKHPELFKMESTGDMFSYTDKTRDVDNSWCNDRWM